MRAHRWNENGGTGAKLSDVRRKLWNYEQDREMKPLEIFEIYSKVPMDRKLAAERAAREKAEKALAKKEAELEALQMSLGLS